ncbi:hypothetical protein E3N88_15097 [Mikania micrantha]|uniref:PB1 domain-containing protein n=1 Tax=Mikania micrantha TaxID=192012 RepID=A0A5N6NVV3_9ASTR|nr:hypothetical protein E3N88_15097 [Mikania micrantha]
MNSGCSKFPDPIDTILSDLLKRSSTPLECEKTGFSSFVFWRENEGYENNSSSAEKTIQGVVFNEVLTAAARDIVTKDILRMASAHTKESAKALADMIQITYPHARLAFVVAMANDKDPQAFAIELLAVGLDICKVQQHIPYEVRYNSFCDVFPLNSTTEGHVLSTLQDFKPRYISKIRDDDLLLATWAIFDDSYCAFVICLRSLETRDFNYFFEFIWKNCLEDSRCDVFLEAILLTIKRCLPSFKFASGGEIGDDLEVVEVNCYKKGQNTSFKIFQGKQPIVADNIMAHSKVTCKTISKVVPSKDMHNQWSDVICVTNPTQNPKVNQKTAKIFLTREVVEKQFGKTMNEAAHNLKVSLSTLKRNCKVLGILEWPGPNLQKRKANDSCTIQINTNEANVTTQDSLTVNINKDIVSIKVENEEDMIKFNLPVSQATFAIVKKTIGEKFKLCDRTFKLKYLDEDGDWILLTSDEEMNDCIHSLRKSDRILARLRVLPTREPVSYPSG